MVTNLVDYSFTHPDPWAIRAAGATGVLRYSSLDPVKSFSVAEARALLHTFDLSYALVQEDGAADFVTGAEGGRAKANVARVLRDDLIAAGLWDRKLPIYCAVDENLPENLYAITYQGIQAFAKALGIPEAVYGPRPFLRYCELVRGVRYLWELGSSSFNTGPEPAKTIQQLVTVPTGCKELADVDWDQALVEDWGQFPRPVSKAKARVRRVTMRLAAIVRHPIIAAFRIKPKPFIAFHPGGGLALIDGHTWQGIPGPSDVNRLERVGVKREKVAPSFWASATQVAW